jgi:5-methylcytosine-specific restriction protein A
MCSCGQIHEAGRCYETNSVKSRGSSKEYDHQWKKFRLWFLAEHPLCEECLSKKECSIANEIHHIERLSANPELKYELSNLKALCKSCHSEYTKKGF